MDEDDGPETHTELAFFAAEDGLQRGGVDLSGWVVVQPELDADSYEATYKTPECTTLSLGSETHG